MSLCVNCVDCQPWFDWGATWHLCMRLANHTTGCCGAYCSDACILHLSLVFIVPRPELFGETTSVSAQHAAKTETLPGLVPQP